MARAFIYAGARSLLVSHWPVDSRSAVVLMGETFRQIDGVEGVDLDGALRHAMVSVMHNKFNPRWSNPAYWAPFFLVGRSGDFAKVP